MTNRIAIAIFLSLIVLGGLASLAVDDFPVLIGRKIADLVHWLAIWR